ncbi:MAG: hypothetical protein AVDCRST_MAG85-2382 [uncultured Solirubrobacteraceae bacterium]|uniref:Uncharacterized protein n=1 Tax=uncultured Solirubrobacteraceae bacterium TaxID=1162706 RepID=A0A6J4T1V5_9ACTN|nr:MAG: hypothetical protein AVDCRST_MAG85-2382 [uncultured Solirubrobacteraceae bacterium]
MQHDGAATGRDAAPAGLEREVAVAQEHRGLRDEARALIGRRADAEPAGGALVQVAGHAAHRSGVVRPRPRGAGLAVVTDGVDGIERRHRVQALAALHRVLGAVLSCDDVGAEPARDAVLAAARVDAVVARAAGDDVAGAAGLDLVRAAAADHADRDVELGQDVVLALADVDADLLDAVVVADGLDHVAGVEVDPPGTAVPRVEAAEAGRVDDADPVAGGLGRDVVARDEVGRAERQHAALTLDDRVRERRCGGREQTRSASAALRGRVLRVRSSTGISVGSRGSAWEQVFRRAARFNTERFGAMRCCPSC